MGREGGEGGKGGGEIVLSADPARAVYVQSPMHGVHTWLTVHHTSSVDSRDTPCLAE